jgi:hypothetical protein
MNDEKAQTTETPDSAASALSARLGFTLLMVKASDPFFDIRTEETRHRIVVKFAKKSKVKINKNTVEASSVDIEDYFIDFVVGERVEVFANGLRNLADELDKKSNVELRGCALLRSPG